MPIIDGIPDVCAANKAVEDRSSKNITEKIRKMNFRYFSLDSMSFFILKEEVIILSYCEQKSMS
jgi:hypothetical protein